MTIEWIGVRAPIPRADVERLEAEWGVRFPEDYVAYVLEHNAGGPVPYAVRVPGRGAVGLSLLLDINEPEQKRKRSMRRALAGIGKWLPEGVLPFAEDSGGNSFCFDFRDPGPKGPRVVFWDHELVGEGDDRERALRPLADSFTDLLEMIHDDEED